MKFSMYQYAVEELVDEQAEHADDDVGDVQEEEDVHDDRFVPSDERALVSHKTHQEDNLIQQLEKQLFRRSISDISAPGTVQRVCKLILVLFKKSV